MDFYQRNLNQREKYFKIVGTVNIAQKNMDKKAKDTALEDHIRWGD